MDAAGAAVRPAVPGQGDGGQRPDQHLHARRPGDHPGREHGRHAAHDRPRGAGRRDGPGDQPQGPVGRRPRDPGAVPVPRERGPAGVRAGLTRGSRPAPDG